MIAMVFYTFLLCGYKWLLISNKKNIYKYVGSVFIGMMLYITYNTRTIYFFTILCIFIITTAFFLLKRQIKRIGFNVLVFAGAGVAAIPEVIVNHYRYKSWSPLVNTSYGGNGNLFITQLIWGN